MERPTCACSPTPLRVNKIASILAAASAIIHSRLNWAARLMRVPLGAGISALASFIALLLPRASPTLFRGIMSTSRAEPVW